MNKAEKLRLARQLEKLKVDVIEAGFPVASQGDFEAVSQIARDVRGLTVAALARTQKEDIDRAWEAIQKAASPRLHLFVATSDIHLKFKLRLSRREVLDMIKKSIAYAGKYLSNIEFSAEDASRTDFPFLVQAVKTAIQAGATTINIPDTVGYALPEEFGDRFQLLRERTGDPDRVIWSCHCHNDLGLALANSLAAVRKGARQVEVTVNGIGERAGNADLLATVLAVLKSKDFGKKYELGTPVNLSKLIKISKPIANVTYELDNEAAAELMKLLHGSVK